MKVLPACATNTAKVYHIVTEARSLAPNPGWYHADSGDYIRSHIVSPDAGIVFKAMKHDCLTAFFIIHFPGNTPDSLGHYIDLEPKALDRVTHMDSLAARLSFREKGLQYQLTASTERYLMATSYCHLMGTVHPGDRYSLGNFPKLGYQIVTTIKKYGGLPRHVLYKSISSPPSFMGSGNNTASVSVYLKQLLLKQDLPFMRSRLRRLPMKKLLQTTLLFTLAFCARRLAAQAVEYSRPPEAVTVSAGGNWGLGFPGEDQVPVGSTAADYLKQFNVYYTQNTQDKVIYLTPNVGYEDGDMVIILDVLEKHNVHATFFLVGNYLQTSPDLIRRMAAEGHNVGDHTFHHSNMLKISTKETFEKELNDLETLYQQTMRQPMKRYHRPPQGRYSGSNLKIINDTGYKAFFQSLAYVNWYEDKQPTKEEAPKKLLARIHPGAIVLFRSTLKTNGQILDKFLTKWEEMGHHFGALDDLVVADQTQRMAISCSVFRNYYEKTISFKNAGRTYCLQGASSDVSYLMSD